MVENDPEFKTMQHYKPSYGEWKYNPIPDYRPYFPIDNSPEDKKFSFSFVRNPWDRAVSCWRWVQKDFPTVAPRFYGDFYDFLSWLYEHTRTWGPLVPEECLLRSNGEWTPHNKKSQIIWDKNEIYKSTGPQVFYTSKLCNLDPNWNPTFTVAVDYIGRIENFRMDLENITKITGFKFYDIPRINSSRPTLDDYTKYYNQRCLDLVCKIWPHDVFQLGYKFGTPATKKLLHCNENFMEFIS